MLITKTHIFYTYKYNFPELIMHRLGYTVTELCRVILSAGFDSLTEQRFAPSSILGMMYS